jgi:thiosulfate/3-mercaptopyruvate sulfurtransferase
MINSKIGWGAALLALLVVMNALVLASNAVDQYCPKCNNGENWSPDSFLTGNNTEQTLSNSANPKLSRENIWGTKDDSISADNSIGKPSTSANTPQQSRASEPNTTTNSVAPQRNSSILGMLAPVSSVMTATGASSTKPSSYDIILDVSPEATEYIQDAISIPYAKFMINGSLKPVSEVAKILGDAGITERDSVLVYGQCLPCGVNSAYVYWVLKYLGHDNVKVLDGGIDDWVAAKLPTNNVPNVLPKVTYTPKLNPSLLATYDYVKNGKEQIVDARSFQEFGLGYIPRALDIPYGQVMYNGRLKSEAELRVLFSSLDKTKPVVVYSDTGAQASSIWFALEALGYNASLYSWQDWTAHKPVSDQSKTALAGKNNTENAGRYTNLG